MKKATAALLILLCAIIYCKAQTAQNYANDVTMQAKDLTDVKGSAYSTSQWAKGTVTMEDKVTYTNMDVKYSEYEDKLVVRDKDQRVMEFNNRVKEFTLSYEKEGAEMLVHYSNGFNVEGYNSKAYFEILAGGKTKLLKKVSKKIQTQTEYGATSSTRSFISTTRYFILLGDKGVGIKKDSKSVLAVFGNKAAEVESYAKTQKLDFKREEDLVKIIAFHDTLN